jgi:hypothetical protein
VVEKQEKDSGITFDIALGPPSLEELARTRDSMAAQRAVLARLNKQFLIGLIAALATLLTIFFTFGIPAIRTPRADPTLITTLILYIPYVILFIYGFSNTLHHRKVEVPRKRLDSTAAALRELDAEELALAADFGAQSGEIAAYQAAVAGQGRALLRGEVEAMQQWLDARAQQA